MTFDEGRSLAKPAGIFAYFKARQRGAGKAEHTGTTENKTSDQKCAAHKNGNFCPDHDLTSSVTTV
jgi:hypothetical protein